MNFEPMFTPKEMLQKGIFGGTYFSRLVDHKEFPEDWFNDLDEKFFLSKKYLPKINFFNVKSGQSQEEWEANGWIHKDDPRGWFEWYCKYYLGRRHDDDERQIKRWAAFCGPKGRWRNLIYTKIHNEGCGIEDSNYLSKRIQQSLLHWSYMVNEDDYQFWLSQKGIEL